MTLISYCPAWKGMVLLMINNARIEELLWEKGITQRQLAAALYLSPTTLNGYIKNRRCPDCETASRIADYLGTSIDYLLGNNCLRHYPSVPLNDRENRLISNYRSLNQHNQYILDELAISLCRHSKTDTP